MSIVTVKSIDADSFALPTLYGKTMLQNYIFSSKSARGLAKNLLDGELAPMSSKPFFPCYPYAGFSSHVMPTLACAWASIYGYGIFPSFSLMKSKRKIKAASIGSPRGCLNA